jgi:transcriptional regulator with GAF, ATPase, and Fis domain
VSANDERSSRGERGAGASEAPVAERLRRLNELARLFAAQTDIDALLPLVIDRCRDELRAEGGVAVLLVDRDTNQLYFPYAAANQPFHAEALMQVRFPADRGIAGDVLRSGRSERVLDAQADPRFYRRIDEITNFATGSVLVAPLVGRQGAIGMVYAVNRHGGRVFADDDLAVLETLAAPLGEAIERATLHGRLRAATEHLRGDAGAPRVDAAGHDPSSRLVGTSPAMQELLALVDSAARSPLSVLLEGETGTGKELVARRIHAASDRAELPFVALNCGALPETLLESELFGYRRGAFTVADHDRIGLFEMAGSGTIFLDEVGDMTPAMQVKLLRVLQEGEILRLGDNLPRRIHARVIAATNRELEADVRAGRFRADLYYRLAAFPVRIPPLRERKDDIPALALHFLRDSMAQHGKRITGIDAQALAELIGFDWPGNVRQLRNELARAVALAGENETIGREHLADRLGTARRAGTAGAAEERSRPLSGRAETPPADGEEIKPLRRARAEFEAAYIAQVLKEQGGNVSRSAQLLGLSRVALHKKILAYGIR